MSSLDPVVRQSIEQALIERDIARAAAIAEGAIGEGQRDPMLLNLVAWNREEAGDFDASLVLLEEALKLAPGDPTIIGAIGAVLRKQGKLSEGLKRLDEAIELDPTAAAPWLERGMALETGGSLEAALVSYNRAAELDPQSASAFGGVASIASRRGDLDIALHYGERALALDPLDPPGAAGMARAKIELGQPDQALAILDKVLATDLRDENLANLASLKGDALDRLGRYAEAFAAYSVANQATARRLEGLWAESETHRDFADRLGQEFSLIEGWPVDEPDGSPTPAFLIGYPRSGTTLVENVLASIPGVEALEERPTMAAGEPFLREGGLAQLAKADRASLDALRKAYWDYVAGAGIDATGKLFVDKDPLKGLALPLIARVFPGARIIVMRRDPRDVVWSCFRANFAPTSAAAEFTDLERAARHYDAVMRSQEAFLAALPLARHELRYEALVADFDAETHALTDFLGAEWTEEMRDFARTARRRGVSTMSAAQVSKPLYDGSRQWQRYEEQLRPILPILEPWVERFGYAA
ncbi:MAG: sulfotransferase [Pseudomonadota bacterium]|nr:sulfotransferase [Pseudomonadota bacterium]